MAFCEHENTDLEFYTQVELRANEISQVCFLPTSLAVIGKKIRFKGDVRSWYVQQVWQTRRGAPEREWLKHRRRTDVKKGTFAKA